MTKHAERPNLLTRGCRSQSSLGAARTKAVEISAKQKALAEEAAAQAKLVDKLNSQLEEVQQEISSLLANLSREKCAAGAQDTPAATADAVRTFFSQLAPKMSEHPAGQARINSVMQMLGELLQASRAFGKQPEVPAGGTTKGNPLRGPQGSCEGSNSHKPDDIDMDDSFLDALAEAAMGGEEAAGTEGGSRAEQVAAAKVRLKAKRGDLAKKLVLKSTTKQLPATQPAYVRDGFVPSHAYFFAW